MTKTPCQECNETIEIPDNAEEGFIKTCDSYNCPAQVLVENNTDGSSLITFGEVEADELGKYYELTFQAGENLKECDKCGDKLEIGEKAYPEHQIPRRVTIYCESCKKIKTMDEGLNVDEKRDEVKTL